MEHWLFDAVGNRDTVSGNLGSRIGAETYKLSEKWKTCKKNTKYYAKIKKSY